MNELRWMVLGVGLLVIALIYLWGTRGKWRRRKRDRSPARGQREPRLEPGLGPLEEDVLPDYPEQEETGEDWGPKPAVRLKEEVAPRPGAEGRVRPEPERAAPQQTGQGPVLNLVVTVMAPEQHSFQGAEVMAAAEELGLRPGEERAVLECYADPDARGRPVFSVANVLEPGFFDWRRFPEQQTPGLLCFLQLPGHIPGQTAFELLISVSRRLAERLGGELCDERRLRLRQQGVEHLRAQVVEFERQARLDLLRRDQA